MCISVPDTTGSPEPGDPPDYRQFLHTYQKDGFTYVEPAGQILDPSKQTICVILGVHPNELPPSLVAGNFLMDKNNPHKLANCHLQALCELTQANQNSGGLPFNVKVIVDVFDGLIPAGQRSFDMPEHEVSHCDGNRVAPMSNALLSGLGKILSDPLLRPLPLKDPSIPISVEAKEQENNYRKVETRVHSLAQHLVKEDKDAIVVVAHADKQVDLQLDESDPNSRLYNYVHSLILRPDDLRGINQNYLDALKKDKLLDGVQVASAEYIEKENAQINLLPGENEIVEGAVFWHNLVDDSSIENLLAMLGFPVVISNELPDGDVTLEQHVQILKAFYKTVLEPISNLLKIKQGTASVEV